MQRKVLITSTDVAAWFLFCPELLAHRLEDPQNWWTYDFAVGKEFISGNLVAVNTDSDGTFAVGFTNQGLNERERNYIVDSQQFRLRVPHSRLYLDGGNNLPSQDQFDPPETDNASFHYSQTIDEIVADAGCELWYLPAYSPDLNKIEPWWFVLKNWMRQRWDEFDNFRDCVDAAFKQRPNVYP